MNYKFSRNQLLALCTVCFLVPALRLFPASSARLADRASWLSSPAALPLMLGYVFFLSKMMSMAAPEQGLGELSILVLGKKAAKVYLVGFSLWFILYGAFVLRTGADRLITTIYPYTSSSFFCNKPWHCMHNLCYVSCKDISTNCKTNFAGSNRFSAADTGFFPVIS